MAYLDWKGAHDQLVEPTDAKAFAQRWNLENERRIRSDVGLFKRRIGAMYGRHARPSAAAAAKSLNHAISETEPADSKWLGKLPASSRSGVPDALVTFELFSPKRHAGVSFVRGGHPPASLQWPTPLKAQPDVHGYSLRRRFIWATFDLPGQPLPPAPTDVKRLLGLDHFAEGEIVYRFVVTIRPDQPLHTPTCLDAHLYHAWAPPPRDHPHPWGLTRDLVDGQYRCPEILVEAKEYLRLPCPRGALVSTPGKGPAIGPLKADFRANR